MAEYDSLILDIDGTIWNTTELVAEGWNKAIKELDFDVQQVNAANLKGEFGKPMDVIAMDLWPELTRTEQNELLALCVKYEHECIEKNCQDITYSGVVETIKKMSAEIDFYVVSNCQSGYVELMLRKTGLESYIKDFECFGHAGLLKAANIRLIRERNHLVRTAYVGDTQGDCDACRECGTDFIFASYGFGKADSYLHKIDSFSQLMKLIKL